MIGAGDIVRKRVGEALRHGTRVRACGCQSRQRRIVSKRSRMRSARAVGMPTGAIVVKDDGDRRGVCGDAGLSPRGTDHRRG